MTASALLDIDQLSVTFGGLRAVNSLSFQVLSDHIHGLIGPNGAGKTTVFNVITRIYRPDLGRVSLLGRDMLALKPHEVAAAGIARTFQNIELFGSLSVLDNVLAGQHTRIGYGIAWSALGGRRVRNEEERAKSEALRLLEVMRLQKLANVPAASLAFGQQRMLELARALAVGPKLLLLDEPAAGMNSRESAELSELLHVVRTQFKVGILLVEHDMRVVMNICDRVTVMQYGEKIFEGTPTQVRNSPLVIEAYLGKKRIDPAH
jgi:branched-chain amino acid transport system ATP-binding protein